MTGSVQLPFNSIEEAVEDQIEKGNFVIVLDSESRENEGDLVIAAELIKEEQMAFMIRYTSGLICAAVSPNVADRLNLQPMVTRNTDKNGTAFTVSVDSLDTPVTTGISAHDRALTCRQLASNKATAADFGRPGHIAPLRARSGGILERAGHTGAGVELCKLAGKPEVGVIGEMIEEGAQEEGVPEIQAPNGMLRRDGCLQFGKRWRIKVCMTQDLIGYIKQK